MVAIFGRRNCDLRPLRACRYAQADLSTATVGGSCGSTMVGQHLRMDEEIGSVRGHRRGSGWTKVSYGLYRPAGGRDEDAPDLAAWSLVLPEGGAFTHLTAAREYGWWLPPLPADLPIFSAVPHEGTRPRRSGLIVSRRTQPIRVVDRGGLPLEGPEETLLACARDLGVLDMVVLIDAALHLGTCTHDDIVRMTRLNRRGTTTLEQALGMSDGRSESPWECLLRLLHEVCDVRVEPQHEVLAGDGEFVARGDLWLEGTTTLHEYDGGAHREKRRQRKDLARERRIGDTEWTRRGYTDQEVLHQAVTILRDADRSLGRPHRPERIRSWHELLAGSLFTPAGTTSLRRRWGLPPVQDGSQIA